MTLTPEDLRRLVDEPASRAEVSAVELTERCSPASTRCSR